MMSGFEPYPPKPIPSGMQDWGDETLIKHTRDQGYNYFVVYNNPRIGYNRVSEIERRNIAVEWLKENEIEFTWVGGRSAFEFAFQSEEDAVLFKMAWGC